MRVDPSEGHILSDWDDKSSARLIGLGRVLIGVPFVLISLFVITPAIIVLAAIPATVDITSSLLLNRRMLNTRPSVIRKLWLWNLNNLRWAIHGGGLGFQPHPWTVKNR